MNTGPYDHGLPREEGLPPRSALSQGDVVTLTAIGEIKAAIEQLRHDVRSLKDHQQSAIERVDADVREVRSCISDTNQIVSTLRETAAGIEGKVIKWIVVTGIAVIAATVGILRLLPPGWQSQTDRQSHSAQQAPAAAANMAGRVYFVMPQGSAGDGNNSQAPAESPIILVPAQKGAQLPPQ